MSNLLQATHSGANVWLIIGLTIIIALPFLGCNIAMPIILRRFKLHEFKASDTSKTEKFFALSEHKVWSAMFLLTLIFEFASGIAGIAFIATSIHAGQVAPSELRIYSMWEFIVGLVLLTLMVLSIINLIIITTKRRILLDKLKKVGS